MHSIARQKLNSTELISVVLVRSSNSSWVEFSSCFFRVPRIEVIKKTPSPLSPAGCSACSSSGHCASGTRHLVVPEWFKEFKVDYLFRCDEIPHRLHVRSKFLNLVIIPKFYFNISPLGILYRIYFLVYFVSVGWRRCGRFGVSSHRTGTQQQHLTISWRLLISVYWFGYL